MIFPASVGDEVSVNTLPGRLELWTRAITLLRDFGLTGGGAGNFEQVVLTLYPPFFTGITGGFSHAHNMYLQMAVDFGLPGLIVFLALLVALAASLVTAAHLAGLAVRIPPLVWRSGCSAVYWSLQFTAWWTRRATPRVYASVFIRLAWLRRQAVTLSAWPAGPSPPRTSGKRRRPTHLTHIAGGSTCLAQTPSLC